MNKVSFVLDNKEIILECNPVKRLIDVLREEFNITGIKEGCGQGECGACSVIINKRLVNSCLVPIGILENMEVLTIEGLKLTNRFEILRQAFEDAGAVQCGFCTPGMIMAAEALLTNNPNPKEEDIRRGISGNLCRCTGYNMIVEAVKLASKRGEGLW
ncbi:MULTISPECIES: (2Fe-2S)-binding protein [unclassified Clostridium]|uniref:(2Fe-2S)-binding protein n=1 Tax=unclassified Clostridium TaxID=2614128 RepID=UPI000ED64AA7|nr:MULTISPECIES: (2Fe-2S)-binding protein [unclassified Clostridium]HCQ89586.1 ferredoxin [Clostridium sp.]